MQDLCSAGVLCAKGYRAAAPRTTWTVCALCFHMRLYILSGALCSQTTKCTLIYRNIFSLHYVAAGGYNEISSKSCLIIFSTVLAERRDGARLIALNFGLGSLWQRQQHHHYSPAQFNTPALFLMCIRRRFSTFCLSHTSSAGSAQLSSAAENAKCIAAVIIMNAKCQHVAPNFVHYYGRAVNVSSKLTLLSSCY